MDIVVSFYNNVFLKIDCEPGIAAELSDYFKFKVPGYMFMPAYKAKYWTGDVYLFSTYKKQLYFGLLNNLVEFSVNYKYQIKIEKDVFEKYPIHLIDTNISNFDVFKKSLKLPFEFRNYQEEAIKHCIIKKRALLLSATSSGKSLCLYSLVRWFGQKKILIIVPTINLVHQMYSDFDEYAINDSTFSSEKDVHIIYAGKDKDSDKKIIISTWQSLAKLSEKYFEQYECVIVDECHLASSKSIKGILEKCTNAEYRIGCTGTLDGSKTHEMVLEGLLGKTFNVTTTKELMDGKYISPLKINCAILKYTDKECQEIKKSTYQDEIKFIIGNQKRNNFIADLAIAMKSNTLILFEYVDTHGKILYELIKDKLKNKNRKVYFIYGKTESDIREDIRKFADKEKDAIIVASIKIFSTGINMRNLQNLIFATPSKSRIRTLQSIGRILRLGDDRDAIATLYDIVDDLQWKKHKNFTLNHFIERIKIYDEQKFDYKMTKINLN